MNKLKLIFVSLLIAVAIICSSCRLSTDELAKQVQSNMIETFQKEGMYLIITEPLMLVHKGGNVYSGLMTVYDDEDDEMLKLSVSVVYDGKTFVWEVVE